MKSLLISISIASLAVVATARADEQIMIAPEVRASAAEQLTLAEDLRIEVGRASSEDDRIYAVARATATAYAVQSTWPNDKEAVFASQLIIAAIFTESNLLRNAEETLIAARPLAMQLGRKPSVDVRLARIYERTGRDAMARETASAAVAVDSMKPLNDQDRVAVLQQAALLLGRLGDHREAADCFARAADEDVAPLRRAQLSVAAAKLHRMSGNVVRAEAETARARLFLTAARKSAASSGPSFEIIDTLEEDIAAIERRENH